jgi:hypothetical protein
VLPLAADERDHILERDREWAEISALLARTASGSGGALVVEGPAGIGKTSLLKVLRSAAGRNGFLVGRASGGSLEQEYSFGAVRQLFEPLVATASDPDLLFVGGAAAAAPLCGRRPPADAHVDHAPGEMLHGNWVGHSCSSPTTPIGSTARRCDSLRISPTASVNFPSLSSSGRAHRILVPTAICCFG